MALDVMDEWMLTGQKPARPVDSCFATDGSLLYSGSDAWAGILDSRHPDSKPDVGRPPGL